MGFFSSDITPEEREQQRIEKTLGEFNIFEGVECEVIFPEKQLKTTGSSGTKKGLATLAFGVIGWAATSGTSQNEENRIVTTIFQVVDKGIVFKNASIDGSDIRIPYNEIIKMEVINPEKSGIIGMITLLKNKRIIINPKKGSIRGEIILNHTSDMINERACGAQYEEAGWGLEHATAEPKETKQESGPLIDEMERLGNMYEKGLLTDDEFVIAKKKLLDGD
ncbi:SHOCT domain-containing protein [uncultured Methanobrevibacter sp.]|uniref:SHOCT domain-containing protein n=1 Tax=uncultured Methanobrevibacter sp. TaxID=253161 RepID=UPI0026095393|nr:SHOCT domain-containing protein [uncultured Methanobrevibacter sp.]